jgi:hypothetical protein
MTPASKSRRSVRLVFPASTCATTPRLRNGNGQLHDRTVNGRQRGRRSHVPLLYVMDPITPMLAQRHRTDHRIPSPSGRTWAPPWSLARRRWDPQLAVPTVAPMRRTSMTHGHFRRRRDRHGRHPVSATRPPSTDRSGSCPTIPCAPGAHPTHQWPNNTAMYQATARCLRSVPRLAAELTNDTGPRIGRALPVAVHRHAVMMSAAELLGSRNRMDGCGIMVV